jgi:segregation and condensation protein B
MIHKKPENLENILEALLFTYGEKISIKKLSEITKKPKTDLVLALNNLKVLLSERGIKLVNKEDYYQLVADKSSSEYIEKLIKSEIQEELTQASLEVLAITAYKGPVSKNQIETIRGVNSSYALRNLALRGLVEKDVSDKSFLYKISLSALRKLGIENVDELPEYKELQKEIGNVENLIKNV